MKFIFTLLFALLWGNIFAQETLRFNIIGKDSVRFNYTDAYEHTYDSCATILRTGHYSFQERHFIGAFKDVSKADPKIVLAEGAYDAEGNKQGGFTTYYPDGTLKMKGSFVNNQPDGEWNLYYKNGKPMAAFVANGGIFKVNNAYTEDGSQTVTNGNGKFRSVFGTMEWAGKLVNGAPDGIWNGYQVNANTNSRDKAFTEMYKNGEFVKGESKWGKTRQSAIELFSLKDLPVLRAEAMAMNLHACNPVKLTNRTNAFYMSGWQIFSQNIMDRIKPYLQTVNIANTPYTQLVIMAEVTTSGRISKMRYDSAFDRNIANGLVRELQMLPLLNPATRNGVPVRQAFSFIFTFRDGMYSFNYKVGDFLD